jgi:hypothetical protein
MVEPGMFQDPAMLAALQVTMIMTNAIRTSSTLSLANLLVMSKVCLKMFKDA